MSLFGAGEIAGLIGKAVDRIWPDKTEQEKAKLAILQAELEGDIKAQLGQLEINKEEAKHASIFVAGWRPFFGWVCGAAIAYKFILYQFLMFLATLFGWQVEAFPHIDTSELMVLATGLLGLGTLRSFEKYKGVTK